MIGNILVFEMNELTSLIPLPTTSLIPQNLLNIQPHFLHYKNEVNENVPYKFGGEIKMYEICPTK